MNSEREILTRIHKQHAEQKAELEAAHKKQTRELHDKVLFFQFIFNYLFDY